MEWSYGPLLITGDRAHLVVSWRLQGSLQLEKFADKPYTDDTHKKNQKRNKLGFWISSYVSNLHGVPTQPTINHENKKTQSSNMTL